MAYQSLYRRYRPQTFAEVRGQDHLVRALRNAVVEGRVGHAYLFSGPRGTGKTSTARILAKVLNCENVVDGEPCGVCASCQAIEHGSSFDVFELDAASNNGVEAIRSLIEKAQLGSPGRTKVYILDEVHMLTAGASNALLKTLEEPPDHVVFVLATTDPQKVLPTIKSRTQHFEVHLLPASDLESLVDDIVKDAGLDLTPEGRDYVLRAGGGSARDTLSALDQVSAAGGVPDDISAIDELVEALCERDTGRALLAVEDAVNTGRSPRVLGENLISRLRDVFLTAMKVELSRLPEGDRARIADQAHRLGAAGATRSLEVIGDAFVGIADAPDPRIPLEVALVRLTRLESDHSPAAIVERLERLERGLGPIGAPAPPAPHAVVHPHVDAAVAAETSVADVVPPAPALSAPADAAPAPSPTPPSPAGGRPADGARQVLAAKRGPQGAPPRAAKPPVAAAPSGPPPASPVTRASAPAPASAPDPAAPAPARSSVPAAVATSGTGGLPTRDALTLAWGDVVLSALSGRAKSRFAGGRFISIDDGVARFGLPNEHHAKRCIEAQAEVEAALSTHFDVPIALKIVVDTEGPAPAVLGAPPMTEVDEGGDEMGSGIDMSQLTDADATAVSSLDRIAEVFPGVEVIDPE
jgi:DNA polymerase-3 subunit gamma/tau